MRFILGVILSLGFIGGGFFPIFGGFSMLSRNITGDDVPAAFLTGAMLILIGLLMLWAVIRARKKARAVDAAALSGTMTAMMLGPGDGGDDFGDDFSD